MKRKLTVALAAAALAVIPATTAMAAGHAAEIVVVHGVPGLEVDILVDGDAVLEGVNYTDVAVTELPGGDYTVSVNAAGTDDEVLSLTASVTDGASYTIAAHLDADGNPVLQAFVNDNSQSGIQPFHLAAFPAVDILSGDTAVLEGVTNGQTALIPVDGGTTVEAVGIGAAGTGEAAIELGDITVPEGTVILAYAIGPDEGADLPDVVTQTIDVVDDPVVPAGDAGLAATGLPTWALALMVLGALSLAVPVVAGARGRR